MHLGGAILELEKGGFSRAEAEILVARAVKKTREFLFTYPQRELSQRAWGKIKDWRCAGKKGKPLAYLLNEQAFYGREFYVDKRVLIPRPETEVLVEEGIKLARMMRSAGSDGSAVLDGQTRILDLGTGSGCIAVTLAKELPKARIWASDISNGALAVARRNARRHRVLKRINFRESNLLDGLRRVRFYLILANLPYIGTYQHAHMDESVRLYEPKEALLAGRDGLEWYRRLFEQMRNARYQPKYLLGEIGATQTDDLKALKKQFFPDLKLKIKPDLAGHPRYFILKF